MDLFAELGARGLVQDSTDREALAARLASGPIGVYVGFDPTADSLHVGHLLGQLTLRRLQLAGHRPFPLAGGATGMVGDPGGRSEERNLLDRETLDHNIAAIKVQLERLLDFEPGPLQATLVDNADWTAPIGVLDFLRDVGKHMTVNQMVAKDSVRHRMESEHGISYTEFSYMLLQANDFRYLCEHYDVELQMGGSDQWGNITTGIDLIRRTLGRTAHGLTWPLLTLPGGAKMGKTAGGAVWLDPDQTSPYQFRQFWVQAADAEVGGYLRRLSLRPLDEVEDLISAHEVAPEQRRAQRALAGELTELVHGPDAPPRRRRRPACSSEVTPWPPRPAPSPSSAGRSAAPRWPRPTSTTRSRSSSGPASRPPTGTRGGPWPSAASRSTGGCWATARARCGTSPASTGATFSCGGARPPTTWPNLPTQVDAARQRR